MAGRHRTDPERDPESKPKPRFSGPPADDGPATPEDKAVADRWLTGWPANDDDK